MHHQLAAEDGKISAAKEKAGKARENLAKQEQRLAEFDASPLVPGEGLYERHSKRVKFAAAVEKAKVSLQQVLEAPNLHLKGSGKVKVQ